MRPDEGGTGTKFGTDKPCVYTRPGRSALDRFSYPASSRFTCESDPVWNSTVLKPTEQTIAQKIADQGRSGLDVVFTMILWATNFFIW